ncbi:allophanate hydrolase [Oceanisphaera profunda]|uniref:Allophanate hydrolase n=1 Tax=Oceanisphaera profunda TaxID=1416627 RepID=A0A1Y0D4D0_9GAMM|nr:biotin-dependent carboxyltransferase family protein [Oceanisphaera profunda]ART82388.1 allophanate hydrolase [Oceanisphaera profunda]
MQGLLTVIKPGPLSTLQDAGRVGVRHLGISQGGPADLQAWGWANWLLGNNWGSPTLEITLGGLTLVAEQRCHLALCGADMQPQVNGQPLTNNQAFTLAAGDELQLGMAKCGVRAYLAVAGGFIAKPVLGSVACVMRDQLGGHLGDGSKLAVGDTLAFASSAFSSSHVADFIPRRQLPVGALPHYEQAATLMMIPGAQFRFFDDLSLIQAFNQPWRVDPRSDRMGIRLQGPMLHCNIGSLISEGLTLGAVQVPPSGQPIILLNDRQTIGGYPRLGTLTPLACARLAQCQPGQKVRLGTCTASQAQAQYREFRATLKGSHAL